MATVKGNSMANAKSKRQYGSGGVYQRKDGMWIGTVEAGWTAAGTRRRITVSAKTEAKAKTKLKEKQRDIARDGLPTVTGTSRTTVKAWSATWLQGHRRRVRPKAYTTDESIVRKWIVPTIGHRRLVDLGPQDVRAVEEAIRKAKRSTTTALYTYQTLTRIIKAAMAEGYHIEPRVLLTPAPGKAVSNRDAIPLPDALKLLKAAAARPDASRWVAALLQGMRQGECLGLLWDHVDLDAGTLTIDWQLQPLPYNTPYDRSSGFAVPDGYEHRHLAESWCLVRPKSSAGERVIPLVPWMASALRTWRDTSPASPYGLVWPRDDGRPQKSSLDRAAWYELQDAAQVAGPDGRRYVLHECRHTTASLLMEAGVDPVVVTAILGHSNIVTSRKYQHARPELLRDALGLVAGQLGLGARVRD